MSGGGNDFVALQDSSVLTPGTVKRICARGHSLGADGVLSIEKVAGWDPPAIELTYFNADGTRAGLCVNGTRCAAELAFHLGWASDRVSILTGAGKIDAVKAGDFEVALALAPPARPPVEQIVLVEGEEVPGWFVDTGVPHFVLEWPENLATAPVAELGPLLREAAEFKEGANVDFVRFVSPNQLEIRTFERGVEGETLACGTGVLAATAVAVWLERANLPLRALTSGGFELVVDGSSADDGAIAAWTLTGDARLVAEGVLAPGALAIPDPPLWTES